jgi:hypothetical protein
MLRSFAGAVAAIRARRFFIAVFTTLAVGALSSGPALATEVTPGHIVCYKLEQNCLAHLAKLRSVKTSGASDDPAKQDSFCYSQYDAAQKTGVWPANKAMPAIACSN